MAKVTVYKVGLYNVVTDHTMISRRMATPEGPRKWAAGLLKAPPRKSMLPSSKMVNRGRRADFSRRRSNRAFRDK